LHYLFDADFCNVASGWETCIVEKNVQDTKQARECAGKLGCAEAIYLRRLERRNAG
jgi:hypothetical protein